jgi:lysozyme family protein
MGADHSQFLLSDKVEALITRLIEREKGYVDHPADNGGPTNYGITLAALAEWRRAPVTAFQVKTLSEAEARLIYRDRYFFKPGFDAIADPEFQEFLFDFAVNSGPGAAIIALQTALKQMGLYSDKIDGGLGPNTRRAIAACNNIPQLYYMTKCERYELLLRFIGRDARQAVFAAGWANRLDELQDA